MAVNKAQATGTRRIMEWFDRNATTPYFSVWSNTTPSKKELNFGWYEEDLEAGRNKLENDLDALEQNGVNELYTILLHQKKNKDGYITLDTPYYASLKFRAAELEQPMVMPMQHIAGMSSNHRLESVLEKMMETQNMILTKLSADEFDEEEDDNDENDMIGGLMKNPEIQAMIMGGIGKIFNLAGEKPVAVAGVTELNEDEVFTIVNSLMDKGVTIEHLRKLNEMSSVKLSSLLLML
jgi:hypothetical protein